jgi:hypothetical protein
VAADKRGEGRPDRLTGKGADPMRRRLTIGQMRGLLTLVVAVCVVLLVVIAVFTWWDVIDIRSAR